MKNMMSENEKIEATVHVVYDTFEGGKEIHMVGESVGVVWDAGIREDTIMHNGIPYTGYVPERRGKPRIELVTVNQQDGAKRIFKPEFSRSGLNAKETQQLIGELHAALRYLQALEADEEKRAETE